MTIQDNIAADEAAVASAQAALDAATVQLAADQAKLAEIQPKLTVLEKLEAELATFEDGVKERATSLVAELRSMFTN